MNKKFLVSATTAALVASAVVPAASAAKFTDIDTAVDHKAAILALADMKIISGYPDGTFKPGATVTRGNVVKFLGKWLVQRGYKIPEDALTKQRFDDVPLTIHDKELIQYAALVKDNKVFEGSNNKLNFNGQMNRQNMALVLTRAVKQVYGVDLIERYKVHGFTTKITDISRLEPYQMEAIIALESVGITQVKKYNPANTLQRGQFASFLNRTIEDVPKLVGNKDDIAEVKVVSPTQLSVTFKNGRVEKITLLTPLAPNTEREMTIYIDGKSYVVLVNNKEQKPTEPEKPVEPEQPAETDFAVTKRQALNGGQYAVTFNQPLAETSTNVQAKFEDIAYNVTNKVRHVALSEDKKTLIFTMENYMTGQYKITLDKVVAENGKQLDKIVQEETFVADTQAPRVKDVEYKDITTTRVYFSEPMRKPIDGELMLRNEKNALIQGATYTPSEDGMYVDVDLTHTYLGKEWVEPGTVLILASTMRDLAGNKVDDSFKVAKLKKGPKDGKAPYITNAEQFGPRVVKVTFSEPIITPDQDSFVVKKRGTTPLYKLSL